MMMMRGLHFSFVECVEVWSSLGVLFVEAMIFPLAYVAVVLSLGGWEGVPLSAVLAGQYAHWLTEN